MSDIDAPRTRGAAGGWPSAEDSDLPLATTGATDGDGLLHTDYPIGYRIRRFYEDIQAGNLPSRNEVLTAMQQRFPELTPPPVATSVEGYSGNPLNLGQLIDQLEGQYNFLPADNLVACITKDGRVFLPKGVDAEKHHEDGTTTVWVNVEDR